jgi:hypothetical protein
VPASSPTTRHLSPLPCCTVSRPLERSTSLGFSASASLILRPLLHRSAISALFLTPVAARDEQARRRASISAVLSRSASSCVVGERTWHYQCHLSLPAA